jgi:hypothetical protein
MHSWFVHGLLYGNWATERAITQVSCGQDACVTLYAPSAPACSIPLFQFVIPLLVQRQIIGREEGERAIEALKTVFRPDAASAFEREEFETLRRAFEGMESENRRKKEGKSWYTKGYREISHRPKQQYSVKLNFCGIPLPIR